MKGLWEKLKQRVLVLRDGHGWYPESYICCQGMIRVFSSDGKACVTFNGATGFDTRAAIKFEGAHMRITLPVKTKCRWRGHTRDWSSLEERYGFRCKNYVAPCYPGNCIEDWRCKKVVCDYYVPYNLPNDKVEFQEGNAVE